MGVVRNLLRAVDGDGGGGLMAVKIVKCVGNE